VINAALRLSDELSEDALDLVDHMPQCKALFYRQAGCGSQPGT
jgi:hypothetical protein